jgi:tRNA(Ile)-lysidine synthase
MPARAHEFNARWLGRRLAALLPDLARREFCLAFSGGADSTALLAALAGQPRKLRALRAVHVDHGLHAHSADWAARSVAVARSLGVSCEVLATQVARGRGDSLEARARETRYRLLAGVLRPGEVLMTAHHEDDQLETVLLMLLRGAGVAGLAAMPELVRFPPGLLVRPLLTRSRAALEAFVRAAGLAHVEDPSNLDERLDRNFLRRRVLPAVRERWPAAAATVSRSARHAAEAGRLLESLARADLDRASHGMALAASALRALPPERRHNALRLWIGARGHPPPPTARLAEISGPLLAARADAHPAVEWAGVRVECHGGLLRLLPGRRTGSARSAVAARTPAGIRWRWRTQSVCPLPGDLGALELEADVHGPVDLGALPAALTIRWRRGGERLTVAAGGARRALKSLLQESRLPPAERARLPLVFGGSRLLAVADRWVDESVQAGQAARRRGRFVWRQAARTREMC